MSFYSKHHKKISGSLLPVSSREKGIASRIWATSAFVIMSLPWGSGKQTRAQQNISSSVRPVHIGVLVRQLDGDPIGYLRSKDFRVFLNGRQLPLTVARIGQSKSVRTRVSEPRVLVVVSPEYTATGSSIDALLKDLPESFDRSFISVVEANGTATNYVSTRQALIAEIQAGQTVREDYRQAFDQLGAHPGRRAVIFVTNSRGRTPLSIRDAAAKLDALVYQVGGNVADNYTYQGDSTTTSSLPAYGQGLYGGTAVPDNGMTVVNNTQVWESFATLSIRDLRVEKSIHGALHDIAKDNEGYYDLQVQVPAEEQTLTLELAIKEDYQISAQAYDLNNRPAPTLILQKNKH